MSRRSAEFLFLPPAEQAAAKHLDQYRENGYCLCTDEERLIIATDGVVRVTISLGCSRFANDLRADGGLFNAVRLSPGLKATLDAMPEANTGVETPFIVIYGAAQVRAALAHTPITKFNNGEGVTKLEHKPLH